jgi:outer membrane protein assembly factor BamD
MEEMNRKSVYALYVSMAILFFLSGWGCGPKPPKAVLDAEDQYAVAKREFDEKHWNQAVTELQKLIFNHPGASFIDSAQYLLGMAYFNQDDYPLAIMEFNKLLLSYPTSQLADDAAFMTAKSDFEMAPKAELNQTHTQKAADQLKNFLDDYPESDRREEAEELLLECRSRLAKRAFKAGHLYYRMKHFTSALIYFKRVLNDFHDTEWATKAQFELAEVFYKQKENDKAKDEYQKFLRDFPNDKLAKKAKKRLKEIEKKLTPEGE